MIRDITIGQYYPAESAIHKMDARLKLMITFVFIVTLFLVNTFVGYVFVIACMGLTIRASKVPFKFMTRGLKSIIVIILFTVVINLFMTQGEHVLLRVGFLRVTMEGVLLAAKMCVRLVLLIIGSSVLTLTTTPIQLTDAIEYILKPFKRIGVPAHEIAMMMTIALRFIPTLLDETDKIMKAQQARGADFDTGNLIQKAKSLIPILVLSARTEEHDKVAALDAGANDYVTKPFGTEELLARVRAMLRNIHQYMSVNPVVNAKFSVNGLEIDYEKRIVTVDGREVTLTQTEYNIVVLLAEHAGRVMTYNEIIQRIWGWSDAGSVKKLQVNMANIRKKLGEEPGKNRYITNKIGIGYRMD